MNSEIHRPTVYKGSTWRRHYYCVRMCGSLLSTGMSWIDVGCMVGILMWRCGAEAVSSQLDAHCFFHACLFSAAVRWTRFLAMGLSSYLFGWHDVRCTWVPHSLAPLTEGRKKRLIVWILSFPSRFWLNDLKSYAALNWSADVLVFFVHASGSRLEALLVA